MGQKGCAYNMVVNIWDRLNEQAKGGKKSYRHINKENKQTTKLQGFLDWIQNNMRGESVKW
jgi:hypothetical protein